MPVGGAAEYEDSLANQKSPLKNNRRFRLAEDSVASPPRRGTTGPSLNSALCIESPAQIDETPVKVGGHASRMTEVNLGQIIQKHQ